MPKNTAVGEEMDRKSIIIRTSIIGIITNCLLAGFKAAVGILSGSIAIVLDAVNNLSDALSSIITIVGTKLAGKAPDRKHPLGYGRIEYISAAIISVIVLYAGITSFVESVKKIIHPELPSYGVPSLIIVAVAIVVKIVLGTYVKKTGEKVNSDSLIASGEDAKLDSVISASTLIAAIIFIFSGISLEAWLGAIISIVIIKAGSEMLRDTLSQILGERMSPEFTQEIKRTIASFKEVNGAYDLLLHNYGPDKIVGSVHIEVPEDITIKRLDSLQREIVMKVYEEHGVAIEAVGIYSQNSDNSVAGKLHNDVVRVVKRHEHIKQIHGFYLDEVRERVSFDMVVTFDEKDVEKLRRDVYDELRKEFPEYDYIINIDRDISD
ncbi:cation diffusion facilitator family transporter [Butyrivibrio sp. MB2005]|uniref:cation diffusion facilitator family transporter n=1 Tax=Butyrivibrio sp. MB2005 TaxID=1280678 RepID=UPI0003FED54D|nr:cation diffusion facilitator family transporter [Butyrivibrio sp. MB2005]